MLTEHLMPYWGGGGGYRFQKSILVKQIYIFAHSCPQEEIDIIKESGPEILKKGEIPEER